MGAESEKVVVFLHALAALKEVERWRGHFFWRDYPQRDRYESVADHTWRMTLMLVVIEPYLSQKLDLVKALKMSLIHDLPEMVVGDPSPLGSDGTGKDSHAYNKDVAEAKFDHEKRAAQDIFGHLPEPQSLELMALWLEFEEGTSFESRVVKAMDKLEGKLQCAEYLPGASFRAHTEFNMTYGAGLFKADPFIQELWFHISKELASFKEFVPNSQS